MQTITIAGRLGKDAVSNATRDGTPVCSFSVAVDYRDGKEKKTNWWRVSLWGARGSALAQYLTKGTTVAVSGEFSLTEYDGKSQLNVRANEVTLLGGGQDGGQRENTGGSGSNRAPVGGGFADDLDDSIPFLRSDTAW